MTLQKPGRIAVTGLGAVTPLGSDVPSTWSAMLAGKSGVRRLTEGWVDNLPVRIGAAITADLGHLAPSERIRHLDRYDRLALVAAHEAWRDAGLAIGDRPGFVPDGLRIGVVVATGAGGASTILDAYERLRQDGWELMSPSGAALLMLSSAASRVGAEFGAMAGVHALVSACASGAEAIGCGMQMIRSGRADLVIAGGSEAPIHPFNIACFSSLRALSTRNDEPERASRPFDKARDGLVLGEGAGMVVLESEEHAHARDAHVYAVAAGVGYSADAYSMVQPAPDAVGQTSAMTRALANAGMPADQIVHVNAHATSTPQGDIAEAAAIRKTLGNATSGAVVTATKSMTGHMLGASGAVESIATVMALQARMVPPTINIDDLDDEVNIDVARDTQRPLPDGPIGALTNSFGFGGHNVSIVFQSI